MDTLRTIRIAITAPKGTIDMTRLLTFIDYLMDNDDVMIDIGISRATKRGLK